ncbi:MAG: hypothetical protein E7373_02390 [Clostridiales bacterium]|jgi:sporulation protein YqfC|nr:hypothetical protein [Clostridiales bacterium]
MNFIESVCSCFSENELLKAPDFKAVLLGDTAGYFECVKSIAHYTEEEIALSVKNGGVIIRGEGLYVKKYCAGDLVVCGKIKSLERV